MLTEEEKSLILSQMAADEVSYSACAYYVDDKP